MESQEQCNEKIDICSDYIIHQDTLNDIYKKALSEDVVNDLAEFFKVFGDPTRLRILHALSVAEMCVCDLCEFLGMNQSAVSHQLKILRHSRLIKYHREGRNVYYSLDDEHIGQIMKVGLQYLMER
ncbi:ArsR family transcriptional regulator [Caldicoprobacter guelmensis]|uniref:ArsR/SmtB family transcription factor n=1 Tax=Caldicoprobacter guelmensis TaxID=1170224 RepID=UPI00195AAC7C|nr:metalloregulator ArsR/SmtB family transcription factor [Caldicoprobacter guelmensis]MBM7582525.1 ArsR family transcriptional regulator [Caldicoprobacter guelmensis]